MRVLVEGGYKEYSMVSKLHIYLAGVYQTPAKFCWAFLFGLARLDFLLFIVILVTKTHVGERHIIIRIE